MIQDHKSTRMSLAGLFGAGLFYAIVVMIEGRWSDPSVILAAITEICLLVAALIRPPVTKRDVGIAILGLTLYIYLSVALGILTELTVMAIGGIVIYLLVMIQPKFPLTKRAISTGIGVGIVMTFLGIYLALKIGVVYFVGAEMLGAIILGVRGKYTKEENTIVVAIANGSSMISMGVLITFPAIEIFAPDVAPALITYPFIVFVTGVSAIFGLLLLAPMRNRFESQPWPQVKPQAECIISMGLDDEAKKEVVTGLAISGTWVGATRAAEMATGTTLASFPRLLRPIIPSAGAVPDWIGMSNSPLVAAIGFFMGWKRVLTLVLGSVISLLIWVVLEGAQPVSYGVHLHRPEILYLALGVFATIVTNDVLSREDDKLSVQEFQALVNQQAVGGEPSEGIVIDTPHKASEVPNLMKLRKELFSMESIKSEIRFLIEDPREFMRARGGIVPPWVALLSISLFTIVGIVVFFIIRPFTGLEIHWSLFVLGAPLALASAYFTAKSISETGMLAGYVSDLVAIPAILFFRATFQAVTTFMSMLGALQDAAVALLVHLKLGQLTGVRGRDIFKAVFLGAMLGTFVGSLMTYMIYRTYHFGTTEFPAPAAQLFGFLVISLQGLGNLVLPGMDQELFPGVSPVIQFLYLLVFGIVGYLLGRELHRRGLSPMSLVVGLLIPPATSAAMLLGGLIDYRLKKEEGYENTVPERIDTIEMKRNRTSRILSGMVAGEAIVTVIWVLWSATLFILG
ncbi:MAG: OPT/YSL family transporter [Candidatus Thorarchaeota archaeon]